MPTSLTTTIAHHPVQEVKSLALDANDNYFFLWTDSSGKSRYSKSRFSINGKVSFSDLTFEESQGLERNYPDLQEWLENRDKFHCKVTFGPTIGHCIVWKETGQWHWHGEKSSGLRHQLKDDNHRRHIKQIALGLDDSYFILFTNGEFSYACNATYPELHKIVGHCRRGDVAVGRPPVGVFDQRLTQS